MRPTTSLKPIDKMPGPDETEGKGNIDAINKEGDLARYQLAIHRKYGHYVKFKLDANTLVVSTTDIHALKECSKIFDKPESLYQFLDPLIGKIMFLPIKRNKEVRKFIIEKFSTSLIQKKFDALVKQLDLEIDDWISNSKKTGGVISIQEKIKSLSMKITVILTCGEEFAESYRLAECIQITLHESLNLQYAKSDKKQSELKLNDAMKYIEAKVDEFITKRQTLRNQNQSEKIFLDELLEVTNDQVEIRNIIKLVLMAGYHTIASSVCWTLYAIAKYPNVAHNVYNEMDSITGGRSVSFSDLPKLKYLVNVIKETLRIYPSGPYTARSADTDLEIGGYFIPKSTIIFYPIWAVHMNTEYWPEPEKFDPDRFSSNYNKLAYLPFGFGARNCTGANIGNVEVLLMLTKILERLSLQKPSNFEPIVSENFVLISKNDITLKITPRAKSNLGFEKKYVNIFYLGSGVILGLLAFIILHNVLNNNRLALALSVILVLSFHYSLNRNSAIFFNNKTTSNNEINNNSSNSVHSALEI